MRPPFEGIAWGRGVADLASAIAEGRPHRASAEQAAHVVDILAGARASMAATAVAVPIASTVPAAVADAVGRARRPDAQGRD